MKTDSDSPETNLTDTVRFVPSFGVQWCCVQFSTKTACTSKKEPAQKKIYI